MVNEGYEILKVNDKFPEEINFGAGIVMEDNSFTVFIKLDRVSKEYANRFSNDKITIKYGSCLHDEGQFFLIDVGNIIKDCEIHYSINEAMMSLDRYEVAEDGHGYSFTFFLIDERNILRAMRVIAVSSKLSNAIRDGLSKQYKYNYTIIDKEKYINNMLNFQKMYPIKDLGKFIKESYVSGTIC